MADSISSSSELAVGLDYTKDEEGVLKNRTVFLKIPNPKSNLTESQIKTAMNTFINQQIILDPDGKAFSTTSVGTAYTQNETKIDIDLN